MVYTNCFRLANTVFTIESTMALGRSEKLEKFQTQEPADITVFVRSALPGERVMQENGCPIVRRDGQQFYIAISGEQYDDLTPWQILLMLPLSELLLERGTLNLHGSYILHKGQGVVFSGPSGIGKSTQAELWHQNRDAQVVNGDRVLITVGQDGDMVASHFLCGSSGICENVTVPLKAVVLLEQREDNGILKTDPLNLFRLLMAQLDYRAGDRTHLISATALVERLMNHTLVCHYGCRMDEDAVACLEQHLYGAQ